MNPNLKFCANISLLFNELPFEQRFAAAKKAGFEAIEVQFPYEFTLPQLIELKEVHQLKMVLINVAAGDLMQGGEGLAAHPNKQMEFERALEECIEYAQALNVSCVNVLPGCCINPAQREKYLATFQKNLIKAASALQTINVKCMFEAINTIDMPHFLINTAHHMFDIITELQHPNLFMQYDIYHMTKMKQNIINDIEQYLPYIGHIQFADCPGRHEPGTGTIDFTSVFTKIAHSNYTGWIGAEYYPSLPTTQTLAWHVN
jgi:hydroxypyruvate isomerase